MNSLWWIVLGVFLFVEIEASGKQFAQSINHYKFNFDTPQLIGREIHKNQYVSNVEPRFMSRITEWFNMNIGNPFASQGQYNEEKSIFTYEKEEPETTYETDTTPITSEQENLSERFDFISPFEIFQIPSYPSKYPVRQSRYKTTVFKVTKTLYDHPLMSHSHPPHYAMRPDFDHYYPHPHPIRPTHTEYITTTEMVTSIQMVPPTNIIQSSIEATRVAEKDIIVMFTLDPESAATETNPLRASDLSQGRAELIDKIKENLITFGIRNPSVFIVDPEPEAV